MLEIVPRVYKVLLLGAACWKLYGNSSIIFPSLFISRKLFQNKTLQVVQSLSNIWLFVTPWIAALQVSLHNLPELAQTHDHWVGDTIQPSHPLSSPSPPALSLAQRRGLFQWVSSSYQMAKVLEFQLHHQSFQWTPRTNLLQDGLVGSPCRIWEVFSFESSFIPGKTLLNSIACYREIICEMQGQLLQQTSLLSY